MMWPAVALAVAALALRRPDAWAVAATMSAGTVGVIGARGATRERGWLTVVGAGVVAVVFVRAVWQAPALASVPLLSAAAGAAEEALFRGALYARFRRPAVAIAVSAVLFGLIHVPAYGWGALPVDVAAGVLFGWQRWASGTWTAPAVTHAVANLVQLW